MFIELIDPVFVVLENPEIVEVTIVDPEDGKLYQNLYMITGITLNILSFKVNKETKIRNRYNQVPHLTKDITRESDKNTIKHHTQESKEVSPFPAGDHKAALNRQESMTNTKHK